MLSYMILTVEQMVFAMILAGFLASLARAICGGKGSGIIRGGVIAGLVAAAVMSYAKNATSRINTGSWNIVIFTITLAALVLFFVFVKIEKNKGRRALIMTLLMAAIMIGMQLFYALPDAMAYPYIIYTSEQTALSSAYILKVVGVIFGALIACIGCAAVYKAGRHLPRRVLFTLTSVVLILNAVRQVTSGIGVLLGRRLIPSNHLLFAISKYASNLSNWFIYGAIIMALIAMLMLFIKSANVHEPYSNQAEHRKIRAKWRNIRRWCSAIAVCAALSILTLTAINSYANQEVELSPIEDAVVENDAVYVSFDQVNDGHLHRFGYTSDEGTVIRFIVIQKPNSSSYGVGLDACEICGETGYYESGDGQVVCNLCDVVMNINTIGFKGGCNPIVIDYEIKDGYIIVPIEGLLEHESEFK